MVTRNAGGLRGVVRSRICRKQGRDDTAVNAPGITIRFQLRVDWLRIATVKPYAQLFHLLRREFI